MIKSVNLGMPRIGQKCEVPKAVKSFINKKITQTELYSIGEKVRLANLKMQKNAGIDIIPSNDFSFFDHMLDTTVLLGNIPRKYYWEGGAVSLDIYFTMAFGQQKEKFDVKPMKISRWFNSNYLFTVPELADPVEFVYSDNKHVLSYLEAKKTLDLVTRPVFFGPVSYLLMSKVSYEDIDDINKMHLVDDIMPVYDELFVNCKRLGVTDIQIDEPMLTKDLTREEQGLYKEFYSKLTEKANDLNIHIVTGNGDVGNNLECAMSLPVKSIHLDLVSAPNQINDALEFLRRDTILSLGLVDAENVWINDIEKSVQMARSIIDKIGKDRVLIGPSSSLFLCPLNIEIEKNVPVEIDGLLSFAKQKLEEIVLITDILNGKVSEECIAKNKEKIEKLKKIAQDITDCGHKELTHIINSNYVRKTPFSKRIKEQKDFIFGSNFQTLSMTLNGSISCFENDSSLKDSITSIVEIQQKLGFDVISDCELNRNSNREFFSNMLDGVYIPDFGFVQHYGLLFYNVSIIYKKPTMKDNSVLKNIVDYMKQATNLPFKINIVGPVTFVNQSFIPSYVSRDDVRAIMANIIKKEISILEKIGVKIIGIDEESIFQYIPIRNEHTEEEMSKITQIFKYICSDLSNKTQIHTKVLHTNFEENLADLACLDSDVLFINGSRFQQEIFESLVSYRYQNHISLGIYDSLSDRIPTSQEIALSIKKYIRSLDQDQIWISPDFSFFDESKIRFVKSIEVIKNCIDNIRKR